jgi:hypothetical protein
VLVDPSPKLQDQVVGLPVEVSVKATVWAASGVSGAKVKEAMGADTDVSLPVSPPHATDIKARAKAAIRVIMGEVLFICMLLSFEVLSP